MTTNNTKHKKQSFNQVQSLCLLCAGVDKEILSECPTDISKYTALGAVMLFIAILAGISSTSFLMISFNSSFLTALFGGIFWSFLILSLDRLLLTTMQKGKNNIIGIIIRLTLSISLSFLISEPLIMSMFKGEINAKLNADLRKIVGEEVNKKNAELAPSINILNDENKRLSEQTESFRQSVSTAEQAYIAEKEGTAGTGVPGGGIVYKEKLIAFERAKSVYETAKNENDIKIETNNNKLAEFEKQLIALEKEVREKQGMATGALARHKAMYAIVFSDIGAALVYIPIFLVLLCFDTLAITTKLFGSETNYERRLKVRQQTSFDDSDSEELLATYSTAKLREIGEAMINRIFDAIKNGTIDKLKSIEERNLAEKIQAWLISSESKKVPSVERLNTPIDFNAPILIRVASLTDIEADLQLPENVAQTFKFSELYSELDGLKTRVENKIKQNIIFDGATTSSGEKIFPDDLLIPQLENDRILMLQYSLLNQPDNGNFAH